MASSAKPNQPKTPSNTRLARVYGVDDRQIARWKKDRAPLLDVSAMMLFFAGRASAPSHLLAASRERRDEMQSKIDVFTGIKSNVKRQKRVRVDPESIKSLPQGAAHALQRLQGEEAKLFATLQAESDPLLQGVCRKQWRETLLSLKQYETLVEADKRDSGETLTRAQVQPMLAILAVWLRRGNEDFLNSISLQISEMDKPEQVYAAIAPTVRQSVGNAVEAATNDGKLPSWVREALLANL